MAMAVAMTMAMAMAMAPGHGYDHCHDDGQGRGHGHSSAMPEACSVGGVLNQFEIFEQMSRVAFTVKCEVRSEKSSVGQAPAIKPED